MFYLFVFTHDPTQSHLALSLKMAQSLPPPFSSRDSSLGPHFRFVPSFRMVEDMLAYRWIMIAHKTVRKWAERFGRDYACKIRRCTPCLDDSWHLDEVAITIKDDRHFANCIRKNRPRPHEKWYLDEVVITIRGQRFFLWHAINANGVSLRRRLIK